MSVIVPLATVRQTGQHQAALCDTIRGHCMEADCMMYQLVEIAPIKWQAYMPAIMSSLSDIDK